MKRLIFSALLVIATLSLSAQDVVRYGYAPDVMAESAQIAQGQGANGFIEALVCFDPAVDPVVARLEGHQIKGVRCYLRADYQQARQKRSLIKYTTNLDGEATTKVCDFVAGWNDIYFDEPITIGSESFYLGMQVYELRGESHPFVSYGAASVPGACWINLNRQGWVNYAERGTLLIQAILDDEAAAKVDNMVYAQVATTPQTVAPSAEFDCEVFFNNLTNESVTDVEISILGQGDEAPYTAQVHFDTPLAPREGRNLPMAIRAGSETGVSQWIEVDAVKANDKALQEARTGVSHHYVTEDAFQRTSLVEEFTSQQCQNCPFMIYFLDKAMEEYDKEVVYLTHHTGFVPDFFTMSGEDELVYLFGSVESYNPAVMYDRYVFPGDVNPMKGATVAETTPYTEALNVVTERLAMASINVDVTYNADAATISCSVDGRVNRELVAAGVESYLSVFLVEDSIPLSEKYFQDGLITDDPAAPADLESSFRHNGVKRHAYTAHVGDLLTLGSENDFAITFDDVAVDAEWNIENCRIVAYVHRVDKNDLTLNEVFNATQKWLSGKGAVEGIEQDSEVRFVVNPDRTITPTVDIESYRIYNVQGQYITARSSLAPGIYIVSYKTLQGERGTTKLLVH